MKPDNEKPALTARCPNCNTPVPYHGLDENPFFPFCCKRCKMVDLDRWLSEEYQIHSEAGPAGREPDGKDA